MEVNRDRGRTLAVAALAVVAVALAAATLSGAVETGPLQDFGLGNADRTDSQALDENASGGSFLGTGGAARFGSFCVTHPLVVYGVPLAAGLGVVYLVRRFGTYIGGRLSLPFVGFVGLPYALLTSCRTGEGGLPFAGRTGEVFSRAGSVVPQPGGSPWLLLAAVLGAGLVALVAVRYLRGDRDRSGERAPFAPDLPPRPANPGSDLAGVADAAGGAADRIAGDGAVDNEVYRAWREMTGSLDVERPASSTPGEFADAAVAEGLDPDRVADLTAVFEAVRYGDADPATYADEAVTALRAIEAEAEAEAETEAATGTED